MEINPKEIIPAEIGRAGIEQPSWGNSLLLPCIFEVGLRTAHLLPRLLVSQFVEQRLGVLEVGGVEALGEPGVDFG
jgi:hypothetical protein